MLQNFINLCVQFSQGSKTIYTQVTYYGLLYKVRALNEFLYQSKLQLGVH